MMARKSSVRLFWWYWDLIYKNSDGSLKGEMHYEVEKFTLTTTTEAVDLVSSMLDDVGIEGIEVEDNVPLTEKETKGMFIDILPSFRRMKVLQR